MANNAELVASLQTTRANLVAVLAAETAAQLAGGAKPTYSLDGVSYSWTEWREATIRQIDSITQTIRILSQPWIVRSRGKA